MDLSGQKATPVRVDVFEALRKLKIEGELRGNRYWAKCPFHEDHKPSWFIRIDGEYVGRHFCFACKNGGSLVQLVMHRLNMPRYEAARWLGGEPDAPTVEVQLPTIEMKLSGFESEIFTLPFGVCFRPFSKWLSLARDYVLQRGITGQQIEKWGVGYAVDGRLGGRVVFVVTDSQKRVVSYMARTFLDHETRYLYPKTNERADLDCMFGQSHWPSQHERREVVVTEGAINALACERAMHALGHDAAIAALGGSNVRPSHLLKLATFRKVYLITDPDSAGDKAAKECERALSRQTRVVRVKLFSGTDAASIASADLTARLSLAMTA